MRNPITTDDFDIEVGEDLITAAWVRARRVAPPLRAASLTPEEVATLKDILRVAILRWATTDSPHIFTLSEVKSLYAVSARPGHRTKRLTTRRRGLPVHPFLNDTEDRHTGVYGE